MTCEYCGDHFHQGIHSEEGSFCSLECEQMELVNRRGIYYDAHRDDLSYEAQQADEERRVDIQIDLEREKDL